MRVTIDPISIDEYVVDQMTRMDQLTVVRNYVRKWLATNPQDAHEKQVSEVEVEVTWLDGDIEDCVFDRMVGFPIKPKRDWYKEWVNSTQNEDWG